MLAFTRWGPVLLLSVALQSMAQTVFTHRAPESAKDARPEYEVQLLRLALDKTLDEYGPYRLEPSPPINVMRSIFSIRQNSFPNFFFSLGYEEKYLAHPEMAYIPFPIDLGALSYRTCFVSARKQAEVAQVKDMDGLRQFSHGQGRAWVDARILKLNGFRVSEVDNYEQLFRMTAANRFDLFCRGINEILHEHQQHQDLKSLAYDRHLLLYYPMPIFFYTNSNNHEAIARVTKGLHKAFADGSLKALWAEHHQASVDFAGLPQRLLFRLDNPLIKSLDNGYERFNFLPMPQTPANPVPAGQLLTP